MLAANPALKGANMFKSQTSDQVGDTISRLWLFAFFTMIFRDLHEMSTASTINGILSGTFEGNPVTDQGLVIGGVALVVFLMTFVLSTVLIPSAARRLNLTVVPFAIAGMLVLLPNDPDGWLLGAMTAGAFLLIFYLSWTWETRPSVLHDKEVRYVS